MSKYKFINVPDKWMGKSFPEEEEIIEWLDKKESEGWKFVFWPVINSHQHHFKALFEDIKDYSHD